jgi:hypothetical protein
MKLVANWRDCWKWTTIRIGAAWIAAQGALMGYIATLNEQEQVAFIVKYGRDYTYFVLAVTAVQTFSRVLKQKNTTPFMAPPPTLAELAAEATKVNALAKKVDP